MRGGYSGAAAGADAPQATAGSPPTAAPAGQQEGQQQQQEGQPQQTAPSAVKQPPPQPQSPEAAATAAVHAVLERVRTNLRVLECCGEGEAYEKAASFAAQDLSTVRKVLLGDGSPLAQTVLLRQLLDDARRAAHVREKEEEQGLQEDPCSASVPIVRLLVRTLRVQEFECRKDVVAVCVEMQNAATEEEAAECFTKPFFAELCQGYECDAHGAVALNCGTVLRAALKHAVAARRMLNHYEGEAHAPPQFEQSLFSKFLKYVSLADFEVASDAFATFRELLTAHPPIVADFMEAHYDAFFAQYSQLLQSENYMTRRQSLKILVEVLLLRTNFRVMSRFIQSTVHLRTVMQIMRDQSAHIRTEAFHLFKLFVCNPKKPDDVVHILSMNRDKLLAFFSTFGESDEALRGEVDLVVKTVQALPQLPVSSAKQGTAAVKQPQAART